MPLLRAQVTIPHDSALPEDSVVNTFHFQTGADPDAAQLLEIQARLLALYNVASAPGTSTIGSSLSRVINPPMATLKVYNMAQPQPRAPIFTAPLVISSGTSSTALPSEVAVCGSYQAAKVSGLAHARRRGRIFFGPLNDASGTLEVAPGTFRPSVNLRNAIAGAMKAMAAKNSDPLLVDWVVFSPTIGNNPEIVWPKVVSGWVDNAFDTQRRRGERSTARTEWT
jgi:hypothetical protein